MKIMRVIDLHYSMFIFFVDKIDEIKQKEIETFFATRIKNKMGTPIILWQEE